MHMVCKNVPSSLSAHMLCMCLSAAHTPDNSFLGFVVEQHLNASDFKHIDDIKRQNQSLVYGKVDNFWKVRWLHIEKKNLKNRLQRNDLKCQTSNGNSLY